MSEYTNFSNDCNFHQSLFTDEKSLFIKLSKKELNIKLLIHILRVSITKGSLSNMHSLRIRPQSISFYNILAISIPITT